MFKIPPINPRKAEISRDMRNCILALIAVLVLLVSALAGQERAKLPNDTLARVGNGVITTLDLLPRLEMVPFPDRVSKRTPDDSVKAKALYAMIAEKLLAGEARRRGLPEDKRIVLLRTELENLFVRDELYRSEIVAKAQPSEAEIREGTRMCVNDLTVLSFLVDSEDGARTLASALRKCSRDSVLNGIRGIPYNRADTLTIKFGAPDSAFENAAYATDASRVSKPFRSEMFGWAVLYLLGKKTNDEMVRLSLPDRRRHVEKTLRASREGDLVVGYLDIMLGRQHAQADARVFGIFASSLHDLWSEDTAHFRNRGFFTLTGDIVDILLDRLQYYLDTVLVRVEGGDLSLGTVLEMFRYADFQTRTLNPDTFNVDLNEAIKDLVGKELLAREARARGLQYSPRVQADMALWSDYWAARDMLYRVRDSVAVSDDDIMRHLLHNKDRFGRYYEVNVREVLADSLRDLVTALEELREGRTLADVAKRRTRRAEWAERGGESGYFVLLRHPELGFAAMKADTGKLVGPIHIPEGYSLFTVLGKRPTNEARVGFQALWENTQSRLLGERRKSTIDQFIAGLAREESVTVDFKKLKRVSFTRIPMFTRRFIGFGGRMTAVPLLMRQWDWYNEYAAPPTIVP
jgi:parvulin-like peptidyl-prolyl isomerase